MTNLASFPLPSQPSLVAQCMGQNLESLLTPAITLDRVTARRNCNAMLTVCEKLGVGFRPHVVHLPISAMKRV